MPETLLTGTIFRNRHKLAGLIGLLCSAIALSDDHSGERSAAPCGSLPHFDRALLLENTSEWSANVSLGDLTGNGNLDVVLAKGRHSPLVSRVLLNDGHGGFSVAHDLGGTAYSRKLNAG